MCRLPRRLRLGAVLAIALLTGCQAQGPSRSSALPNTEAERLQLIQLLAQEIFGPPDPLDTPAAHWESPLRIAVVGPQPALRAGVANSAMAPLLDDISDVTGRPHGFVGAEETPNVLVVVAENIKDLPSGLEQQIDRVLRGRKYTQLFERMVAERGDRCLYIAIDDGYVYYGAVIYSAIAETDPQFIDCVGPSLAGVVGLQGNLEKPGSIKSPQPDGSHLTDIDRKALRILYGKDVRPGQKLREIEALQGEV
jgi:hypothetical protein